jgi:integrase
LAAAYLAAGCPTRKQKFKRPSAAFITAEKRQAAKLVEYFRTQPVAEVNDLLQIEPYARWRLRQFEKGHGGRAVDKEVQTLSNIINFAVFATKQERINFIHSNRPRYHVVKSRARQRMPENADVIHQLCDYFFAKPISEVFAWITLFQMFTGCRTSELLRLRLNADPQESGHVAAGHLHLGRRSKSGINPFVPIGPEFGQMLDCFNRWHRARFLKFAPYFPGLFGEVIGSESHCHALTRACRKLALPHITPHGLRAYAATKWLREGRTHAEVAAMLGDKTAALIGSTYADAPGESAALSYLPSASLPSWLRWQPEQTKIARIA